MKIPLSYDKQPITIGQNVYQIGVNSTKNLQLVVLKVINIISDQAIQVQTGTMTPTIYSNQVYSNAIGLVDLWIDQNLKWYNISIPNNLYHLFKIKESLGSNVDPILLQKFVPVTNEEI